MEVKEQAERKIAQLHTRIQQLESKVGGRGGGRLAAWGEHGRHPGQHAAGVSPAVALKCQWGLSNLDKRSLPSNPLPTQVNRLGGENSSLLERLQEAQSAVAEAAAAVDAADAQGNSGAVELAAARQVRVLVGFRGSLVLCSFVDGSSCPQHNACLTATCLAADSDGSHCLPTPPARAAAGQGQPGVAVRPAGVGAAQVQAARGEAAGGRRRSLLAVGAGCRGVHAPVALVSCKAHRAARQQCST